MMRPARKSNNQGMALLMALFFISIAVVIVGMLMARTMQQRKAVAQYEDYNTAFLGVETAIALSKVELEHGEDGIVGMENWEPKWSIENEILLPDFDDDSISPQSLQSMEDVQYASFAIAWAGDGEDNNGNGLVDDATEDWMYTVYAMAKKGAVTRRVEVVYQGANVNVWDNAVFAGPGELGGLISGSVNARGSVHMLGDNLLGGVLGLATLGLTGTTTVRNNYSGIPATLEDRIPAPPQTMFEGEVVGTLGAKLRARSGLLGLSGASTLGDPQVLGNTVKETLDAVFVTGGWVGDTVIPDGDRGDPSSVYSDNGWDELYDLGDKVSFPTLDEPWLTAQGGAEVTNPGTGNAYKFEEYFSEVLVGDENDPDDGMYSGNITIDTGAGHFYWNATTGDQMSGTLPGSSPPKTEDYILFDKNSDILEINGQIVIDGDLKFKGKGTQKTIYYTGKGAILVKGGVQIDSNLVTINNGDKADIENSFPGNNALGVMAAKDIKFGSSLFDLLFGSDLHVMGAFYAGEKVTSLKSANVAGTLVSNYFDLTLNPPAVYEVPVLQQNLPEGMVGDYPIIAIAQVSWRELGI